MKNIGNYKVLEKTALKLGCSDAKAIPSDQIVVEDRVRLRCMIGCPTYGKNLKCPPYTPSVKEFRDIVNEYDFAMLVKLKVPEISRELEQKYKQPAKNEEFRLWNRVRDTKFEKQIWSDFSEIYKTMLTVLLELEKAAFNQGCPLATSFFGGKCILCEKCNIESGVCMNPLMARYSSEAMGVNLFKTAENVGMDLKFHKEDITAPITPMAILLID